jgi:hypothetical protein
MKLTKSDRQAFVRAVMQDVPMTDYVQMARDLILVASQSALPEVLQQHWKEVEPYLNKNYYWGPTGLGGSYTGYGVPTQSWGYATHVFPKVAERLRAIEAQAKQQNIEREATKRELTDAINGCTTLKQARERFPDLVKYLPADREPTKAASLPAVRTEAVMSALTRAGWKKAA